MPIVTQDGNDIHTIQCHDIDIVDEVAETVNQQTPIDDDGAQRILNTTRKI
jgi:hypothetical protein